MINKKAMAVKELKNILLAIGVLLLGMLIFYVLVTANNANTGRFFF